MSEEEKTTTEAATPPRGRFSLSEWLCAPRTLKIIVWVGLIGMGLILLSALFDTKKTDETATAASAEAAGADDYAAVMEQKLREMLLCVDGVSDCQVMVTLESGRRVVYDTSGKEPLTECQPTVRGVVVVLNGTADETAKEEACRVVKTALHLAEKRVCVVSNTSGEN